MSQQAFANMHGMSVNAIARYETGRVPSTLALLQFAHTARQHTRDKELWLVFYEAILEEENPHLSEMVREITKAGSGQNLPALHKDVPIAQRILTINDIANRDTVAQDDLLEIQKLSSEAFELLTGSTIRESVGLDAFARRDQSQRKRKERS